MTDLLQNKTWIVSDVSVKLHSSELIFTLADTYFSSAAGQRAVCEMRE